MSAQATDRAPTPALAPAEAPILVLLLGANLVAFTADLMMNALYPALALRFGVAVETVVLLGTPRALAQLGVLALGSLSDRVGRAVVMVAGLFLVAAGGWGGAWAPHLGAMAAVQLAFGLGFATVTAGIPAIVGDRYPYAIRGRLLSLIQLALPLSLIAVVPALVALTVRLGATAPFVALGSAAAALALITACRLPGAVRRGSPPPPEAPRRPRGWLRRGVVVVLGVSFCMSIAPTAIYGFLAAWVGGTFGDPGRTVGLAFACDGLGALLGVALSALLVDRLRKRMAAVLGMAVAGLWAILLPATRHSLPLALVAVAGIAAFIEVGFIAPPALLSELVPEARGAVLGLWASALALGGAIAPFLARILWRHSGMTALAWAGGGLLLALAAILALARVEPQTQEGGASGETAAKGPHASQGKV